MAVQFKNGENITAGHLRISLQLIAGMIGIIISLVVFIYLDFRAEQKEYNKLQDAKIEKFYNQIILITGTNSATLEVIKEYLEHRDDINLDNAINERYKLKHSRTRGGKISDVQIANKSYYNVAKK